MISRLEPGLLPLEDSGYALAPADAHGLEAEMGVAALHLVQQGGEDAGAGGGYGVAQRDAGAVDVQVVLMGQFPLAQDCQHLGGEGFVQLDEVHVLKGEADSCP